MCAGNQIASVNNMVLILVGKMPFNFQISNLSDIMVTFIKGAD